MMVDGDDVKRIFDVILDTNPEDLEETLAQAVFDCWRYHKKLPAKNVNSENVRKWAAIAMRMQGYMENRRQQLSEINDAVKSAIETGGGIY